MPPLASLWDSFHSLWRAILDTLPRVGLAVLVLVVGWIVAKVVRRLTVKILRFLRVDALAEQAGMEDVLLRGDVKFTTVTILANVLYWFIMFASAMGALHLMGLNTADELFRRIVLYIPNIFVAVVVLIFGSVLGRFVRGAVLAYLNNVDVAGAEAISATAQAAVVIFVVSVALEQLDIGGQILISAFQIAFGAICLALALAFGLGGREWAAHLLERLWKK
jgi:hypothetical protein